MASFHCKVCGGPFEVPQSALDKYPGWEPKYCREHSPKKSRAPTKRARSTTSRAPIEENLPVAEVMKKYSGGPQSGVFTDGSCQPNPGPGGWGYVWVRDGKVLAQGHGHDPNTTNNRMELTALLEALSVLPPDAEEVIFSDSRLCVQTLNEWAASWEKNGWQRKGGPIKNLDLVKRAYALFKQRPKTQLRWIAAHNGNLWNEVADSLSTAWMRDEV